MSVLKTVKYSDGMKTVEYRDVMSLKLTMSRGIDINAGVYCIKNRSHC
jgi:hypothetical protein